MPSKLPKSNTTTWMTTANSCFVLSNWCMCKVVWSSFRQPITGRLKAHMAMKLRRKAWVNQVGSHSKACILLNIFQLHRWPRTLFGHEGNDSFWMCLSFLVLHDFIQVWSLLASLKWLSFSDADEENNTTILQLITLSKLILWGWFNSCMDL